MTRSRPPVEIVAVTVPILIEVVAAVMCISIAVVWIALGSAAHG
jgi:hypothetical protein